MEGALILKVLLAAGGFAVWAYQQLKAKAEQPAPTAMAAPPPIPRRVRKPRVATKPAAKASEESAEGPARPAATPHLDASDLVVTRPARALSRSQFRGAAALRQAIVAREVLGPPLCLRPPRF
ncbi:MAG: hypothetical protein RLZZ178_1554 [Verrucomicrobiota bacterium]|jgi:hypothetical protein